MPSVKVALASKNPKTVVRRNSNKVYGVFIDGVGLDRASRRLKRKVDMAALVKGLTIGSPALLARYYTLLPQEDDSRHRSFLDAVAKAGLEVFTKRLPPKGIERQVAVDVEMAADIIAFALGREDISRASLVSASGQFSIFTQQDSGGSQQNFHSAARISSAISPHPALKLEEWADLKSQNDSQLDGSEDQASGSASRETEANEAEQSAPANKRVIVVVCPSRELAYPLAICKHLGADTISADFGQMTSGDLLKSAAKWIDLSDSQTIFK